MPYIALISFAQKTPPASFWVVVFLIAFSILAWIRYNYPNRWSKTIRSTFNVRMTKQFMREESLLAHRSSAVFLFLFCMSTGALIYLLLYHLLPSIPMSIAVLVWCIIGVVAVSLIHWGMHSIVAFFTMEKEAIGEYMFTLSLIHRTSVLVILPLAFFLTYSSENMRLIFIVPAILALVGMLVYRIIRGLRIAWEAKLNGFYFILYLCALEILPLLLVGKGLMDFISIT